MKIVKIYPEVKAARPVPFPFMIAKDGMVGRQDFWKGKPLRLVGFQKEGDVNIDLLLTEFWECPKMAVGMFPVFLHSGGTWNTYFGSKVGRVSIEK